MKQANHIAFKCTYNNGNEGRYAGFKDVCSDEIIKYNIEKGHIWCSNNDCACKKYYNSNFKGLKPQEPCAESVMFSKKYGWAYSAGYKQTNLNKWEPNRIRNTEIGKLVILTTRFPDLTIHNVKQQHDIEEKRRIIGFFRIGEIVEKRGEETVLYSDGEYDIKIPLMIAKQTYFWDNYATSTGVEFWGFGLFRYLDDKQVYMIVDGVIKLMEVRKTDVKQIQKLKELLKLL
jgi:hypothetical protein